MRAQREQRMKLTWTCDEQLFRQEIENADDVRLSVRLFAKCMPDKRKVRARGRGRGRGDIEQQLRIPLLP